MVSSTGTSIEGYFDWAKNELDKKNYGEVSLIFTVNAGQVTYVKKGSIDNDQFQLKRKE